MKIAALDLGSNTFICLIVSGEKNAIKHIHEDLTETVRLGQGLAQTGKISAEALQRADKCLEKFQKKIFEENVDKVMAVATSAARDAVNGKELIDLAKKWSIPVQIISGKEEADLTFYGAISELNIPSNQKIITIDIGGGSTEIGFGEGSQLYKNLSLDIGGVRLTEAFISHQPVSVFEQQNIKKHIQKQLELISLPAGFKTDFGVAIGGTPTSIVAAELGKFDKEKTHEFVLKIDCVKKWNARFAESSVEYKKLNYGLGARADIIYVGSEILLQVMEKFKISDLRVSSMGVRYGLALKLLSE